MSLAREPGGWIRYESRRRDALGAPPASFSARYRPFGDPAPSAPGTLEHFLTERYSLFSRRGFGVPRSLRGGLLRGDIEHDPWPLQPAEVVLERNDMFRIAGLEVPSEPPLAHYATDLRVRAQPPRRVAP